MEGKQPESLRTQSLRMHGGEGERARGNWDQAEHHHFSCLIACSLFFLVLLEINSQFVGQLMGVWRRALMFSNPNPFIGNASWKIPFFLPPFFLQSESLGLLCACVSCLCGLKSHHEWKIE
jgi:hypothetical protein